MSQNFAIFFNVLKKFGQLLESSIIWKISCKSQNLENFEHQNLFSKKSNLGQKSKY